MYQHYERYGTTHVHSTTRLNGGRARTHQARCACGWEGQIHDEAGLAWDDAVTHETTMNDEDEDA